ncbi:hypothetical protein J6590_061737 [Homalodisca vitripennis]|nr:hypothetical protein J6590_061737 [Homalodisca vitripennis]
MFTDTIQVHLSVSISRYQSADATGRSDKPLLVCWSARACPLSPVVFYFEISHKCVTMICGKRQLYTSNDKEVAKCPLCSVEFHATCCRIRTFAKQLSKMSSKGLKMRRCDVDGDSSANSDDPIIMDLLKTIKQEMSDARKSNSESFASLEKTMVSVRESLEEVKDKPSTVESHFDAQRRLWFLKTEIGELQQISRCDNIEIMGVVESIAKAIGVVFNKGGISIAHRIPAPRDRRFHSSIVVQFVSRSIRVELLTAGEHLTAHNKAILGRAKVFVKFGKLAYAWSREGRVMVRKTADAPAQRVSSFEDRIHGQHKG